MATIDIHVDDKACVGCSLCAQICPTEVFEFNEETRIPEVKKAAACFGCLSCAEICPSTALIHANVPCSESFYHDPYALNIIAKSGKTYREFLEITDPEKKKQAMSDLGVRLMSVASVLKQTLGQSFPVVGTMAGRSLASQLPRYQTPRSLQEVLQLTSEIFSPAWNLSFTHTDETVTTHIKECFTRDVCTKEKIDLGGDLCILFFNYLAGYIAKISGIRIRFIKQIPDSHECVYEARIYP